MNQGGRGSWYCPDSNLRYLVQLLWCVSVRCPAQQVDCTKQDFSQLCGQKSTAWECPCPADMVSYVPCLPLFRPSEYLDVFFPVLRAQGEMVRGKRQTRLAYSDSLWHLLLLIGMARFSTAQHSTRACCWLTVLVPDDHQSCVRLLMPMYVCAYVCADEQPLPPVGAVAV